ncbi:MAG TPA: flagellar assembly peptidoglycan hydrolase FlgJ [Gammaproteobacteria bacterium]|nr:flagellar assembly peptidoglycan hydrolase FlgJ [Gammaproteobacteria bacterium]
MPVNTMTSNSNYADFSSLAALRGEARTGGQDAAKKVAGQFEAIFIQMMLSNMRKTVEMDEKFSNEKSMYYDLFDKQIAINMAEHGGIGLAKLMMTQLSNGENNLAVSSTLRKLESIQTDKYIMPMSTAAVSIVDKKPEVITGRNRNEAPKINNMNAARLNGVNMRPQEDLNFDNPMQFIDKLWGMAKKVVVESGLDPRAIIAQAALETGWGKHIIKNPNGTSSNNLFGIKSNKEWSGSKVRADTLEFRNGVMTRSNEEFRAYNSIEESLQDYVNFIRDNNRYSRAMDNSGNPETYAKELQRAGYATDPVYAKKIINIINGKEFSSFFRSMGI